MLVDYVVTPCRLIAAHIVGAKRAILANLTGIADGLSEGASETATRQPMYGQVGFYCRPDPATGSEYAEYVGIDTADGKLPIAGRDLRLNSKVNPKDGECGAVQYGGGFISLAHNADKTPGDLTGTTTVIYAPKIVGGSVEKAHAIVLDTSASNLSVSIVHANGCAVLLTPQDKVVIKNAAGDAYLEVTSSGIAFNGNTQLVGGLVVSPGVPSPQPVALAPAIATYASAVNTFATAVGTFATAVGVAVPAVAGAAVTLNTAVGALASAATALTGTFPGGMVSTRLSSQ